MRHIKTITILNICYYFACNLKIGFDKMYKNRFAYVCIAPKKLLHFNKNRETVDRIKNVEYNYK